MQDVLLKVYELGPREFYPPAENFLFRMLQNLYFDQKRAEKASVRDGMESLDAFEHADSNANIPRYHGIVPKLNELPDKESAVTESQARTRELQVEARLSLENLSLYQKEAVELYHCRSMTRAEIAEILGITEIAVEKRVEKGIKNLRKELGVEIGDRTNARPVRAINADGEVVHNFTRVIDAQQAGFNLAGVYRSLKKGKPYRGLKWNYASAT